MIFKYNFSALIFEKFIATNYKSVCFLNAYIKKFNYIFCHFRDFMIMKIVHRVINVLLLEINLNIFRKSNEIKLIVLSSRL